MARESIKSVLLVQDLGWPVSLLLRTCWRPLRGRDVSMANAGSSNSQNNEVKGGKGAGKNSGKARDNEDVRSARPTAVLQKMVPVLVDLDRRVAAP